MPTVAEPGLMGLSRAAPRRRGRERHSIVLSLIPIMGLVMVFLVVPVVASFILSFTEYGLGLPLRFVGLANYIYAFTQDRVFLKALRNTVFYAAVSVPLGMAVSLAVAQLIHSRRRLKSFFRTAYFLPVVTPMIAVSIVWRYILMPSQFGILNSILLPLGIKPQPWLNSSQLVIPSLIVISVWSGMGYNMVLFLAGLVGIPVEFYEAARIDGASSWRMFRDITWPLLAPTVLFVTVTGSIGALQIFSVPFIITRGGPENASMMAVMWIQSVGFLQTRMGYASALAYLFFIIILALTIVELRYMKTRWSY